MRIWIIAALTGLLGYLGFVSFQRPGDGDKEKVILSAVIQLMERQHFKDVPLNDDFSEKLYHTYMDRLDGQKRFLIMGDVDLLDDYRDSLDDELMHDNLKFFDLSYDIINKAIDKTRHWYGEILSQPFDFTSQTPSKLMVRKGTMQRTMPNSKNYGADT
jgi:hypothetical protein